MIEERREEMYRRGKERCEEREGDISKVKRSIDISGYRHNFEGFYEKFTYIY